jgi:heat shock protein HslJ
MKARILLLSSVLALLSGCAHQVEWLNRPIPPPQAAPVKITDLAGSRWLLTTLDGQPVSESSSGWATPGIDFANDGQSVSGFAGVNRFGGRYTQDGAALTFGPLALTRRIGPAEQMELESRVTRILSGVTGWRQRGEKLELISAGRVGAVFKPIPSKKR